MINSIGEDTKAELDAVLTNKPKMSIEHPDFLKPQRLEGETDYQYKVRRNVNKMLLKQKKKGTLAWIAKDTRLPIHKDPNDAKSEIIGYQVSKGFTYNKEKFNKAIEEWTKKQEAREILKQSTEIKTETND